MSPRETTAIIAASMLFLVVMFQLLLAAGLPLGRAAWGGQHRILPPSLRWGSLAAASALAGAGWASLARADLVAPGAGSLAMRVITWTFAGMFALNTLGNGVSKSRAERYVMTPITALLCVCFLVLAAG